MRNNKNNATLKVVQPGFSPGLGEIDGKMISTWNFGIKRVEMTLSLCHTKLAKHFPVNPNVDQFAECLFGK